MVEIYHDWVGHREERLSGARGRRRRAGCRTPAAASRRGREVLRQFTETLAVVARGLAGARSEAR